MGSKGVKEEILGQIEEGGPGAEADGGEKGEEESRELHVHDGYELSPGLPPDGCSTIPSTHHCPEMNPTRLPVKKITLFVFRSTVQLIPVALQWKVGGEMSPKFISMPSFSLLIFLSTRHSNGHRG